MGPTPDSKTITLLQRAYRRAVVARDDRFSPDVSAKLKRFRERDGTGYELAMLAVELLPFTNFKVDDVDWGKDWDYVTGELRHNGLVVRIEPK